MTHVEVVREASDLDRLVYVFTFFEDRMRVVLERVSRDSRPTRRHKWTSDAWYERLGRGRPEEPPLPLDVIAEAEVAVRAAVHFERWSR